MWSQNADDFGSLHLTDCQKSLFICSVVTITLVERHNPSRKKVFNTPGRKQNRLDPHPLNTVELK